ncbi:protein of unknown function (plasmid) [Cupriavidus taiwanensis]|uniref:Uncharacterized protein n=1 Tax=Cupriavidus taiwanensis TaxID=164546 RepID=A0A9Q7XVD0_9BURK|nr:protein of unknown function [Cupriavidus taiwanensis]
MFSEGGHSRPGYIYPIHKEGYSSTLSNIVTVR